METRFHPSSGIFNLLSDDELDALAEDIEAHGQRVPIVVQTDHEQNVRWVLDGRNRYLACQRAGVVPTFQEWDGEGLIADLVWSLNGPRRHLDEGERQIAAGRYAIEREAEAKERQVAAGLLNLGQSASIEADWDFGRSREKAAEKFGISDSAVDRAVKVVKSGAPELVAAVESGQVSVSAAADVATLPKPEQQEIVARGEKEILEAAKAIRRETKTRKKEEKAAAKASIPADLPRVADRYRLIHADIRDARIDAESVDVVLCDPPYPKEFLDTFSWVAQRSEEWLKPGGSLLVMSGQSWLPEVLSRLTSASLRYHWTLAYMTPGGQSVQLFDRRVNTFWKPVFWLVKGAYDGPWVGDVASSKVNDNDKRFHGWGQSESGMADLLDRVSMPGQTVLDPFCGGGTTGAVALRMNRFFVGIDLDEGAIRTTAARLAELSDAELVA